MRFPHTAPFYSVLSALGLFAVSPIHASIVRSDVDYRYFRDFAENKGIFAVGASNIEIADKQGKILGTVLNGVPMPDFRVANRQTAIATLVHPQYVNSVKHNLGYGSIQFGNETQNPEEQAYTYRLVSRNLHPNYDYHLPRLNKLVTEIAPAALSSVPMRDNGLPENNAYLNAERFPYFVRLGSGGQKVRDADGNRTQIASGYQFLTGGTPLKVLQSKDHWLRVGGSVSDQPMNTYGIPGDSGSPLFAFDAQEKRWVLAGVLSTYTGFNSLFNNYIVTLPEFIRNTIDQHETALDVGLTTNELVWRNNGNGSSTLTGRNEKFDLPVADSSLSAQNDSKQMPSEDAGKTLVLSSPFDSKTLTLADNINQGAGALRFNSNFTVAGKNRTWQGAGVVVADGKRVFWQVGNPKGDRLSKLGAGTLFVNGQGINQGDISVGEGTVVLAQKPSNGITQAFGQVGITSGRGTVVLTDNRQISPDNIYFGFRGGRLDLNGNDTTFTHIRHADSGAHIVNHNPDQAATLTLTGKRTLGTSDVEWVNWGNRPQTAAAVYEYVNPYRNRRTDYFMLKAGGNPREFFPWDMESTASWQFVGNDRQIAAEQAAQAANAHTDTASFTGYLGETDNGKAAPRYRADQIEWVKWSQSPTQTLALYEYVNPHRGRRTDYYRLKEGGNPRAYFPWDAYSTRDWEFLGHNRAEAIEQTVNTANAALYGKPEYRHNGALNLHYRPERTGSTLLLSGGMNLNGEVRIESGNLILSGKPVPHAYDHQAKLEPVFENEWTDSSFAARSFKLAGNASLTAGRNVARIDGNFTAEDNAALNLGFVQGATPVCHRSNHSGDTHCTPNAVLTSDNFQALPQTQIHGNIALNGQSALRLGKAHLHGSIQAGSRTAVRMAENSGWTLTHTSQTGNLTLEPGAQITLNTGYGNNTPDNGFNTLTVKGKLDGSGTFRFLTDLAAGQGDRLHLDGDSDGAFSLQVKNSGKEPESAEPLSLVSLNPIRAHNAQFSLQNGYADLGAYRYILRKHTDGYRLYNPLKEAEQQVQADRETHNRNQQAYDQLQNQLQSRRQETERLAQANQRAQDQKARSEAELRRLNQEIGSIQQNYNHSAAEYRRANRVRILQRRSIYSQYLRLQNTLNTHKQQAAGINRQVQTHTLAAERARQAWETSKAELDRLNLQAEQLSAQMQQNDPLADILTRAQNLCTAQGQSADICRQVAKAADERDLTLFEAQLDEHIAQIEAAETALQSAQQTGDNETVEAAQQAYSAAAARLAAQFDQLQTALNTAALPVQANLISRTANTAVSEHTAHNAALRQTGQRIDRHLTDPQQTKVWAAAGTQHSDRSSHTHRPSRQETDYTHIGISSDISDTLNGGIILTDERTHNRHDDNIRTKTRSNSAHLFIRGNHGKLFAAADAGYSTGNTKTEDSSAPTVRRHAWSAGINTGINLEAGINIRPTAGIRLIRSSGAHYTLDGADIREQGQTQTVWHAGIRLDKTIGLGKATLTPSFSTDHYRSSHRRDSALTVNDRPMQQHGTHGTQHTLGISAGYRGWTAKLHAAYSKDSDTDHNRQAGLKIGYSW